MQTINKEWLKNQHEANLKAREEASKFFRLEIGENIVKIDETKIPLESQTKTGYKRFIWTTEKMKGTEKLTLSASPILNGLIIEALLGGFNPFTLIKTGEGKNTRYSIKEIGH